MTRSEFSRVVAKKMQSSIVESRVWVEVIFDTLTEEIMSQDKVTIMKFGTFKRKLRKPKRRGDINTGKAVLDPARTLVSFIPSEYMAARVAKEAHLEE